MRNFIVGLAVGILAVFAIISVPTAFAQSRGYESAYVRRAASDIQEIESSYQVARNSIFGGTETITATRKAYSDLQTIIDALEFDDPPVPVSGINEQIIFASQRCQNFASVAKDISEQDKSNPFSAIAVIDLREYCAVQIQDAKLRLIDYAVAHGVNPFAK